MGMPASPTSASTSGLDPARVSRRGVSGREFARDLEVNPGEGKSLSMLITELPLLWFIADPAPDRIEVAAILAESDSSPILSLSLLLARSRVPS